MHQNRIIAGKLFSGILLFILVLVANNLLAQDGKALFISNCATCHNPIKQVTGPALQGVTARIPDTKLLHSWIKNNEAVLATGNKYFVDLKKQYNGTAMNLFPSLTDPEIDAILKYVETYKPPTTDTGLPGGKTEESDNSLLYGILTLKKR